MEKHEFENREEFILIFNLKFLGHQDSNATRKVNRISINEPLESTSFFILTSLEEIKSFVREKIEIEYPDEMKTTFRKHSTIKNLNQSTESIVSQLNILPQPKNHHLRC